MMYAKVELYRDSTKLLQYTVPVGPFVQMTWKATPGDEFVDPASRIALTGLRLKIFAHSLDALPGGQEHYGADEANGAACRAMANALRRRGDTREGWEPGFEQRGGIGPLERYGSDEPPQS